MTFGDGTGPWGEGPMTGRGLGPCDGVTTPGLGGFGGERLADVVEEQQGQPEQREEWGNDD
jgi:hypothetical protein